MTNSDQVEATFVLTAKQRMAHSGADRAAHSVLWLSGTLLLLSGLIHLGVWLIVGGAWEGPVSWRKPILFGFSTGATVLSMAWLYPKLASQKWDLWLCGLFGLAMNLEVGLITVQQWRGVASHFNHSTPWDASIEYAMTLLIIVATLVLCEFTRRSFISLRAAADLRLAIQAGMLFLMVSCLIGFAILLHGENQIANQADPGTYGTAGVTKFPHGVAIHAIQFLPIACWLFAKLGLPAKTRTRMVAYLVASTGMFLFFSCVQTLQGRARFDWTFSGLVCLIAAAMFLLPVLNNIAKRLWGKRLWGKQRWVD